MPKGDVCDLHSSMGFEMADKRLETDDNRHPHDDEAFFADRTRSAGMPAAESRGDAMLSSGGGRWCASCAGAVRGWESEGLNSQGCTSRTYRSRCRSYRSLSR